MDVGTLVRNADRAMYTAKERGRNLCSRFEARMSQEAEERLQLEQRSSAWRWPETSCFWSSSRRSI